MLLSTQAWREDVREPCAQVLCDFQGRCVRRDRLAEWWAKMDALFRKGSYWGGEPWWMCPPRDDRGPSVLGITAGHASYRHESYEWHWRAWAPPRVSAGMG